MKIPHYKKRDRWFVLVALPPMVLVINYFIFGQTYLNRPDIFVCSSLISGLLGYLCARLLLIFARRMQERYPLYAQTRKRISYYLFFNTLFTFLSINVAFFGYDAIAFFDYKINFADYKLAVLAGFCCNLTATGLIEGFAYFERLKKITDEAVELKNENLQTQLQSLKAQVNPHFLFNSLNTLSSLINEDPKKAEKFLLKFSKVYRYLLVSSEENLTQLSVELQFIQSYFHLLKTRHNDGLTLTIRIEEQFLVYMLPSLTLQLLIENAVKHNIMEKERPLNIVIESTNDSKLQVSNNLQPKTMGVNSNNMGLNNIAKKYKLLKQDDIEIRWDKERFMIAIPLIKINN